MTETVECAVIGAGVVGLAIARRLARAGIEVIVLEAADAIGTETSSRNSEVVHAGIYYPKDSRKARTCVAGREQLYAFCRDHGVPHRKIGKLIVATSDAQLSAIEALKQRAADNGVDDLRLVDGAEAARLEPAVRARGGLLSPSTGIVDSHAFMLALQGDAEDAGAMIAFLSPVRAGRVVEDGIEISAGPSADETMTVKARHVINSAGLAAQSVAGTIAGVPAASIPPRFLARGCYFTMTGKTPFRHLIYPMPEPGGLGVHVTLDMAGQTRFGPDVEWIDDIAYDVDPARATRFYPAIRTYYPDLADDSLQPGYAGIRPKVVAQGAPAGDFILHGPADHGVEGLINLYGVESPGLTAALALADEVAARLSIDGR